MRIRRVALATAALFALLPAPVRAVEFEPAQMPPPVTLSEPTSAALNGNGTGLCAASAAATSREVQTVFANLDVNTYAPTIDGFIEERPPPTRIERVIRTVLDLSNNNRTPSVSYGDFTGLMQPTCKFGGCDFVGWNDPNTSFASRIRGFLNVTDELAGKPVHIGFYVDDAVSLTFYEPGGARPVLTLWPYTGFATWRFTNTVTFEQPGLYPLEILYTEFGEHAALEMSYLVGEFKDFARSANIPGDGSNPDDDPSSLKASGFTIFRPTQFFQTLSGVPSFPDLNQCQQCPRRFAGGTGNHGCPAGYHCNEAALCAPCDSQRFCGPTCMECGGDTPFCIEQLDGEHACGQCRDDYDCEEGYSCDPVTHTCHECNVDPDCPRGEICVDHACTPCETGDRCAGNSCNCCPNGINGEPMQCGKIDPKGPAVCYECDEDADCPNERPRCHLATGHCVESQPQNAEPNCCGEGCVDCRNPEDPGAAPPVPFCLPGPIGTACAACRNDLDCLEGEYCLSGECKPCITDRRCGPRCDSCGGDTPYCLGKYAETATCVRCTSDEQCAGTTCNLETHECEPGCLATCGEDTPYCDGEKCVECFADTQCPCGNTCDLATNTCDVSCKTNRDCLGNEHCRWKEDASGKECALGPMPDDVACGGTLADVCSVSVVGRNDARPHAAWLFALGALALLERKRRRSGGGPS